MSNVALNAYTAALAAWRLDPTPENDVALESAFAASEAEAVANIAAAHAAAQPYAPKLRVRLAAWNEAYEAHGRWMSYRQIDAIVNSVII